MAIKLVINSLIEHDLDQSLITFGRSKSCHIELHHKEVSRRHFIIKFVDDAYIIIDEGSRHGTMVDGRMLSAHENMVISNEHVIKVPGFLIKLYCDGQRPKLERTTVVARKLLDELLHNSVGVRECPYLQSRDGKYRFDFVEEKTSFVLGKLTQVDFVVNEDGVSNEHLSFVRDINGIRLNPLPHLPVTIDGSLILEPHILAHDAVIGLGSIEFIFKQTSDQDEINQTAEINSHVDEALSKEPPLTVLKEDDLENAAVKLHGRFRILDRVFLISFFVVMAGACVVFLDLV